MADTPEILGSIPAEQDDQLVRNRRVMQRCQELLGTAVKQAQAEDIEPEVIAAALLNGAIEWTKAAHGPLVGAQMIDRYVEMTRNQLKRHDWDAADRLVPVEGWLDSGFGITGPLMFEGFSNPCFVVDGPWGGVGSVDIHGEDNEERALEIAQRLVAGLSSPATRGVTRLRHDPDGGFKVDVTKEFLMAPRLRAVG